jgi:hypothetical protein
LQQGPDGGAGAGARAIEARHHGRLLSVRPEARNTRLGRKSRGQRIIANLPRRAFDEIELILEKDETVRLRKSATKKLPH